MFKNYFSVLALLSGLLFATPLFAESEKEAPQKRELPKSGILATATDGMNNTVQTDKIWGDDNSGKPAPIAGSISKSGTDTWTFSLSNTDPKDTYYAYASADLKNQAGGNVSSATMSVTLKPGESQKKEIRATSSVTQGVVTLQSWKNLSEKKEKTTPTPKAEKAGESKTEQPMRQEYFDGAPTPPF